MEGVAFLQHKCSDDTEVVYQFLMSIPIIPTLKTI